ncbi:uncharacterized protein LOC111408289 [Olea europaea var. sylvestris]|uniref:uncharacterized protein LOC111408289 n=1 Tax=Olea europaea var. sylvestris TaxID=158386 RepID=UPI000C1CD01A|nr:uncharacterized protein LOC111408289 [Olea europaea var. sylvestris]
MNLSHCNFRISSIWQKHVSQFVISANFKGKKMHSTISIPPLKVTSEAQIKHLIQLNQVRKTTPICVSLLKKNVIEGEHEVFDGEDRNENDFWDALEIAREDHVVISGAVATHHNVTVTRRIYEEVQDNEDERPFTNQDLIDLSRQRHESGRSSHAGLSTRSSNCSRVVPDDEDLHVDQLFDAKRDLQEAMYQIAMRRNFEFKVKKSNKSTYTIICVDNNCSWRLSATKMDTNEFFVVRKYAREHTCEVGICQNDHRQARSWFIGRQIMHKFQDPQTIYRPTDIINDIRREYGVVMSYQKAWKAKECALEDLMGSTEESYAKLARYCHNMVRTNSNSTFFIETDGQNRFKKVDYCYLSRCQYPNLPSCIAMRWFFTKLREVIGNIENLAFVIDRGQSIINGIAEVFPEAHHGYCMCHIQGNLKTRYQGSGIVALFRRTAETYSFEEFTKFMGEIEHKSESTWEYLSDMGVEHWARSHFPRRRYNMMTSNNAESLNALFKKDRDGFMTDVKNPKIVGVC